MPSTAQTMAIAALASAAVTLQGCAKGGFKVKEKNVYSNSKYLADIQHGMTLKKCKHYCSNWGKVCEDVCKKDKACALTDDVDARHFTRDASCKKKCVGFNMHGDEHCTLFGSNVELEDGGKGTFYAAPGAKIGEEEKKDEKKEKKDEKKEKKDEKKEKKVEKKDEKEEKKEKKGVEDDGNSYGGNKDGGNYGESNSNSYGGNSNSNNGGSKDGGNYGESNRNSYGSNNNGNYGSSNGNSYGNNDGGNYGESNSNSYEGNNNNGNYGGSKDGNSYSGSKDN